MTLAKPATVGFRLLDHRMAEIRDTPFNERIDDRINRLIGLSACSQLK